MKTRLLALLLAITTALSAAAENPPTPDLSELLNQARQLLRQGDARAALKPADQAVQRDPQSLQARFIRGQVLESLGRFADAVADYDHLVTAEPANPQVYLIRGSARFKNADIAGSLEDFDRELNLAPDRSPHHWQRGIALYYAGRFADGRRQFEIHRRVNPHDVENAAWHFLCHAREKNSAAALADLIPIDTAQDTRIPMAEIFNLFAGKQTPQDVLAAAGRGSDPRALKGQMLYAHLYLGLWHEAHGRQAEAAEHLKKAAGEFFLPHYMGQVAQVHVRLSTPPAKD